MNTFLNALLNTLIGMGTVFVVLIIISLIISLFKYIPDVERKLANVKKKKKEASAPAKPEPKRPALTREELMEDEELAEDGELAAVIMAAIAASGGGAVSADRLVVRSIKRAKKRR